MTEETKIEEKNMTLEDLRNMSPEKKNDFADRLLEQLQAAEKSKEMGRTSKDIVTIDMDDFSKYTDTITIYDEQDYRVLRYKAPTDLVAQFAGQIDGLVRLDEFYKLDIVNQEGLLTAEEYTELTQKILYTQGNVQGVVSDKLKEKEGK